MISENRILAAIMLLGFLGGAAAVTITLLAVSLFLTVPIWKAIVMAILFGLLTGLIATLRAAARLGAKER